MVSKMTEDLTLNMDAYLPLRDVVFNTLREAILKPELKPGERIAQLVVAQFTRIEWESVSELSETERGAGGFGSTGRK